MRARAMPWAMAPAWPLVPPPITLTVMSNLRCVPVTRSGARAAISRTRRPRYASGSFSFTVTRPSPGEMRTRAIAFFLRPVPRFSVSANLHVPLFVETQRLRLLRRVPVLRAGVHAKALQHIRAEGVALQHSLDRGGHREGRIDLLRLLQRPLAQTAGVSAVTRVLLGLHFGPGHLDLGRVDHHDVVAAVQVRREGRLVLATQDRGHA